MARLDVYRLSDGELVVDCQSDIHRHLDTRFVIPLVPFDSRYPVKQDLNPVADLQGQKLIIVTEAASTISARDIAGTVGNIDGAHDPIVRALDFLTGGF